MIGKATQTEQTMEMETEDELYSWVAEFIQCNISFIMTKDLKNTCSNMIERSLTAASSAATQPAKLIV